MHVPVKPFRAGDWWQGKVAVLFGLLYISAAYFNMPFVKVLQLAALSITTIIGFASFGYLVNDLFDREKDALAGKPNFLLNRSALFIFLCFLFAVAFAMLPWYYLPANAKSAGLVVAEIALFLAYSVKPIRLKERGGMGVLADALYAHTVPALLAGYTYMLAAAGNVSYLLILLLAVWQTATGIRNIFLHQVDDILNDAVSGVKNFVALLEPRTRQRTVVALIAIELLASLLFFSVASERNIYLMLPCAAIVLFALEPFWLLGRYGFNKLQDRPIKYYPNYVFEKWVPVSVLLGLSFADLRFLMLVPIHFTLFSVLLYRDMYNLVLLPVAHKAKYVLVKGRVYLRWGLSLFVNHSIYYVFLVFGVNLKKEGMSAVDYIRKREGRASGNKNTDS